MSLVLVSKHLNELIARTGPHLWNITNREGGTKQTCIQLQQILEFHIFQITVYTISLSIIIASYVRLMKNRHSDFGLGFFVFFIFPLNRTKEHCLNKPVPSTADRVILVLKRNKNIANFSVLF